MTCQKLQWPCILLNLSQVWTMTREVKFIHPHLEWVPSSCFWCFSKAAPEKTGGMWAIPHGRVEWGKADLRQPPRYSVVDGCSKPTHSISMMYVDRNRKSSHTSTLTHASYGFDYKLLPFSVSGAIYHLWDLWDHFLQRLSLSALETSSSTPLHRVLNLVQIVEQQREEAFF